MDDVDTVARASARTRQPDRPIRTAAASRFVLKPMLDMLSSAVAIPVRARAPAALPAGGRGWTSASTRASAISSSSDRSAPLI